MTDKYSRFSRLGFDDFRRFARDESKSCYEKIGFPDEYRKGWEQTIFDDIKVKLPALNNRKKRILDIGPGCSDLAHYLFDHSVQNRHELILVDSAEMLELLPENKAVRKIAAYYPNCPDLLSELYGTVDVILCYSVFHYIVAESNMWNFLDQSLMLLAAGGAMLIGDIPNISKRKRFFDSSAGKAYHRDFMDTDQDPEVKFNCVEPGSIDDSLMVGIVLRARLAGFDAYILPQDRRLPMANRREDILIIRP